MNSVLMRLWLIIFICTELNVFSFGFTPITSIADYNPTSFTTTKAKADLLPTTVQTNHSFTSESASTAGTATLTSHLLSTSSTPTSNPNRGLIGWGINTYGQVNGKPAFRDLPTLLTTLPISKTSVTNVSAGYNYSLSVDSSGQVWAWGDNSDDQLGGDRRIPRYNPVQVKFPDGVAPISAVEAITSHSLALSTDGKVYQWGRIVAGKNLNGGVYGSTFLSIPQQVIFPTGVSIIQISAGAEFNLALDSNGQVWSWGLNNVGQLGDGTTTDHFSPIQVTLPGGVAIKSVKAGREYSSNYSFSLALSTNNQVYAWGDNTFGELGDGSNISSLTPELISNLANIGSISASATFAGAISVDGKVYLWGTDPNSICQNSSTCPTVLLIRNSTPQQIAFPTLITTIALGWQDFVAMGTDGKFYTEGANTHGEAGNGTLTYNNSAPVPNNFSVPNGATIKSIVAGQFHIAELNSDGSVYLWGDNSHGQLGIGEINPIIDPALSNVPDNITPQTLAAGADFDILLSNAGQVYGWGRNQFNQTGTGLTDLTVSTPTTVTFPVGVTITSISVDSVAEQSLALDNSGVVWAWGAGGDVTGTLPNTVSQVHLPNNITATLVAEGGNHDLVLGSDGIIYAWGFNLTGQLGNGTAANTTIRSVNAVQVQLPPLDAGETIVQLKASGNSYNNTGSSMALSSKGRIFVWGDNKLGQLGLGENAATQYNTPQLVTLPGGITATTILNGDYGTGGAIGSDGKVYFWGVTYNSQTISPVDGQSVDGAPFTRVIQTLVIPNTQHVVSAVFGGQQMLVRTSDGELFGGMYNAVNNLVKIPLTANPALFAVGLSHDLVWFQDDPNTNWSSASDLGPPAGTSGGVSVQQNIIEPGGSKWFKFSAGISSTISVNLTGMGSGTTDLPADFDISLHRDLPLTYSQLLTTTQTAVSLSQSSAADLPTSYLPTSYLPTSYLPTSYLPTSYLPTSYLPTSYLPTSYLPTSYLPTFYLPITFTPAPFQPTAGAPSGYNSQIYFGSISKSLLSTSAQTGLSSESITRNTWGDSGTFYIQVKAKNDQASLTSFQLNVSVTSDSCSGTGLSIDSTIPIISGTSVTLGAYKTVILTDYSQLLQEGNSQSDLDALNAKLNSLATRTEVNGIVVNLGDANTYGRVAAAKKIANDPANLTCAYTKNILAKEIKNVVDSYAPQSYVVLAGDDDVIPFFRYPDVAGLADESEYTPPVADSSSAQAALKNNLVLGQDEYGSNQYLTRNSYKLPLPGLPVGRLVRSAGEINRMIDVYTAHNGLITPQSALVTGYNFVTSTANQAKTSLQAALQTNCTGSSCVIDSLISDTWTESDIKSKLVDNRYDLMFLAGHFSAGNLAAADTSTTLNAAVLAASAIDHSNSLVMALGCHSGYSIPSLDTIVGASPDPDWVRAFAQQGMTSIVGTGYQYGDTDVIAYSAKLYLSILNKLRTVSGISGSSNQNSVAVGQALMDGKKDYLASTAQLQGVDEKSLLEAAVYGLPMQGIVLTPLPPPSSNLDPVVLTSSPVAVSGPGQLFSMSAYSYTMTTYLTPTTTTLTTTDTSNSTVLATYYSGSNGVVSNPLEPIFPLEQRNVSVDNNVLRGVVLLGANYSDQNNVFPMTVVPATELASTRPTFASPTFYPSQFWSINYLDAASGGKTHLVVSPIQYRSNIDATTGNPQITGTFRKYQNVTLKLYYTGVFTSSTNPIISNVTAHPILDSTNTPIAIRFSLKAVTDPQTEVQEIWATYTADSGNWYGQMQSIKLSPDPTNATGWIATLPINGNANPDQVHFMIQAVSGTGLVTLDTNAGQLYNVTPTPSSVPVAPPPLAKTQLNFVQIPTSAEYQDQPIIRVQLQNANTLQSLANQPVVLTFSGQQVEAFTDSMGIATFNGTSGNSNSLSFIQPGTSNLNASYPGVSGSYQSAITSTQITVSKRSTNLILNSTNSTVSFGRSSGITATLQDNTGHRLANKLIQFKAISSDAQSQSFGVAVSTNANGEAGLGIPNWAAGQYQLSAVYNEINPYYSNSTSSPTTFNLLEAVISPAPNAQLTQGALVGTAFKNQLKVVVRDNYGVALPDILVSFVSPATTNNSNPVAGGVFSLPGLGGTATALTDSNGVASAPVFSANNVVGSYSVIASVKGSKTTVSFNLTNLPSNAKPPTVTTRNAIASNPTVATLIGTINANYATTTQIYFEYGQLSSGTFSTTVTPAVISGATPTTVTATLTGLLPNTIYSYRLVATNLLGTNSGNTNSFRTAFQPFDYNLVTLGNLQNTINSTASSSSGSIFKVGGKTAVGGNANLNHFSLGYKTSSGDNLVVDGNLSLASGTLYGNAVYSGTLATTQNTNFQSGMPVKRNSPLETVNTGTYLVNLSHQWQLLAANGSAQFQNSGRTLILTGNDSTQNVFSLSGTDLVKVQTITVNIPSNSIAIINVNTPKLTLTGSNSQIRDTELNSTSLLKAEHVVFNFADATQLEIDNLELPGSVLAPNANINFLNVNIDGTLIANAISGINMRLELAPFVGNL